MRKLTAKGTYQNYDTNFIPVVPYTRSNKDNFVPGNPDAVDDVYLPCGVGQKSPYTEVVVFEKAQCLPRYLVTLHPTLVRSPRFLESESSEAEVELEKERMRRLLIRQREMILYTGTEKDYLSADGTIINEQEMELIYRRSILVPNSPDDLPDYSPKFSKSRGKQPLSNFSKDFGINRKSTLLEEDSLFTSAVLSEPGRFPAVQKNYAESSSSSRLLVASPLREDSSSSVMINRPKTTLEEPLSMDLDEIHDAAPLLFSVPQSTTVYSQSSNIVAEPLVATIIHANFDRLSI